MRFCLNLCFMSTDLSLKSLALLDKPHNVKVKADFFNLSHVLRKTAFCICENKDADQLRGNRKADKRLSFLYMDSAIPLLSKSEISSL